VNIATVKLSGLRIASRASFGLFMVVLRLAYSWDCEECGRESFVRGIVPEMSADDIAALREEHGVEAWEAGDFLMMPDEVECAFCGARFATTHMKDA
jgi:hypothetical protein